MTVPRLIALSLRDAWPSLAWIALLGVVLFASTPDGARGAASTVVVTMDVPSAISLTNDCQDTRGFRFGVVQPGAAATTATGAGLCSLSWTSSNDTAMLRIGQRDNTGAAMARVGGTPTLSSDVNATVMSVDVYDASSVVASGRGLFRWSSDGGDTWSHQDSPAGSGCWCSDVEHVPGDPTRAFLVGDSAMIRVTGLPTPSFTNLYTSLTSAAPTAWPAGMRVHAVAVISASTVVVSGPSGWVAKSTNANVATPSWAVFQVGTTAGWIDVDAVDANTMYLAGDNGRMGYTTTGGGAAGAWTTGGVSTESFEDLAVADATHLYVVGAYGRIYTCSANPCTTASWVDRTTWALTNEQLMGVGTAASQPNTAWAISGPEGSIFKTTDGGVTWSRQDTPNNAPMRTIDSSSGTHAVAAGAARMSLRTIDGSLWTVEDQAANSWNLRDVDAASADGRTLVAVGTAGLVRRSTDGGTTWATIASGTTSPLFGVSFGSDTMGWAVGGAGRILRTTDRGLTWTTQTSGSAVRLLAVQAVDELTAWAVGDAGTVLRTTNGGTSWVVVPITTTRSLRAVSAPSALNVWVVGEDGVVRVTANGGSSWTTPSTGPAAGWVLHGVTALDGQTAWIATNWSTIWKTTNGGVNWTAYAAGSNTWNAIDHASADVVYAAANGGGWAMSTNGGITWSSGGAGNPQEFGIVAIDESRAAFVGESGSTGVFAPAAGATSQVADYGASPNDWAGSGTSSLFGVCLQDVSAATTVAAGWTKDTTGGPQCVASDADPWRAVPPAATKIGSTLLGATGRVDLVWGVRPRTDQATASYSATVVFEALAPNI